MPPNDFSAVRLIPALKDNYIFAIVTPDRKAFVVDPGEAIPVEQFLEKEKLQLGGVLITHHHNDHIGGVSELVGGRGLPVWAPAKDQKRTWWDLVSRFVKDGDVAEVGPYRFEVMELPGHTLDHIAYYERTRGWLFCGDVLFGLGCGRLFEGTFEQGYESLQRIKDLPDETLVFCAHEYTEANLRFVQSHPDLEPKTPEFRRFVDTLRELRNRHQPSVPRLLADEKRWNPFLNASNLMEFRKRRELRNRF